MNIVCINLDHRPERWESFQQEFKKSIANDEVLKTLNFTVHRLSATCYTDGIKVDSDGPARGCTSSHMRAIELAQSNNWPWVLVMEDDARWSIDAGVKFQKMMGDITTLNINPYIVFLGAGTVKRIGYTSKHMGVLLSGGIITSTHAVIYMQCAYQSVINTLMLAIDPKSWCPHIDLALSNQYAGHKQLYLAIPFVARFADDGISDVRKSKTTNQDLLQLEDTECKLIKVFEKIYKTTQN